MIESIVKPLRPSGPGWVQWPTPDMLPDIAGYPIERWYHRERGLQVLSAVEVAMDKDRIDRGPEYHISVTKLPYQVMKISRCTSDEATWMLAQFGLAGAEEDNHVAHGFARNFWRTVAEPMVGLACGCKADEPAIVEDKGDYVWRP